MSQSQEECVLKRNGSTEIVSFDKILKRIKTLVTKQWLIY